MAHEFLKKKKDIEGWLRRYRIEDYDLVEDEQYGFSVLARSSVDLEHKNLAFIPVKFSFVQGNFYCGHNELTTLEFAPQKTGGNFHCETNKLTSLKFAPQHVGNNFSCSNNRLTSLEYCPETINGNFHCIGNNIASLEFCPKKVRFQFYLHHNPRLGETQDITHFVVLQKIHQSIEDIKNEKNILSAIVAGVDTPKHIFKV